MPNILMMNRPEAQPMLPQMWPLALFGDFLEVEILSLHPKPTKSEK